MKRVLAVLIVLLLLAGGVRADITSNLVAHWKLDETSGTVAADSSGNGHTGTYVNSPTLNQTGAFGSSKAVTFASASSQYVSLGLKSASATNQTIAFWFNASDLSGTRNVLGWGKNEVRVSPTAVRYYADNDTAGGINWATTFNAGTWYHVVVSHSGTSATIYVNGVSLGSQTVVALDTSSFTSSLAAYNASSNYFSGTLDDVRIYSRALSAGDVAELYAYTGARFPYWYFNSSGCDPFKVFRRRTPLTILTTR